MTAADWIQFGSLLVVAATLGVMAWQTLLQNRLLKAQLLRDRFEMYWATYDPVSDEQVAEFRLYPDDYFTVEGDKSRYKGDDDAAIRRYIYMSSLYEYLAFTDMLRHLKVPDPLGVEWLRKWTVDLCASQEFRDVHANYRGYYPNFERFVDDILAARQAKLSDRA